MDHGLTLSVIYQVLSPLSGKPQTRDSSFNLRYRSVKKAISDAQNSIFKHNGSVIKPIVGDQDEAQAETPPVGKANNPE